LDFTAEFGSTELRLFLSGFVPIVDLPAMKEEHIEVEGRVQTVLPGTMFRVELDSKHLVLATIYGKMRKRWVRLTVGDRVKMEMSPYDLSKARIAWRLR
jgi:translation initiation factor IF-1